MTIPIVDYALMAGNAYRSTRNQVNWIPFPEGSGWDELSGGLGHREDGGFEASAYKNGNEIVISFAGTGPGLSVDWVSNGLLALGLGGIDPQLLAAVRYYEDVKAANHNAIISNKGMTTSKAARATISCAASAETIDCSGAMALISCSATRAMTPLPATRGTTPSGAARVTMSWSAAMARTNSMARRATTTSTEVLEPIRW